MGLSQRILYLAIFLFTLGAGTLEAAQESLQPPAPQHPAIKEEFVHNPVFECNVLVCESGKQNPQELVLIHGVGDEASSIWFDLMEKLAERFHLISFDLPGFGRSEKENTLYSPDRYDEFIRWVINRNTKGPVILLGHSMGGALALHYAATYPETIKQLIVVDAAAILHRVAISKNFIHIEEPDPDQGGLVGIIQKPFTKPLHIINHIVGTTVEKLELPNAEDNIDTVVGYKGLREVFLGGDSQAIASLALVQEDFTDKIRAIPVPTSIIWGRNDDIAPLRTAKLLAGKIPVNRLRIIENSGHVPITEQKEAFDRILLEEIESPPETSPKKNLHAGADPNGRCENQSNVVFSGIYDSIRINGCRKVLIKDVSTAYLSITGSEVIIEDSRVNGGKTAVNLERSKIIGTNVVIEGETAILASRSRMDLAGVDLKGRVAALATPDKAVALFSVSRARSPYTEGHLHGIYRLTPERTL